MTKRKHDIRVTTPMIVGWLTSVSMVLAAVLPVLPAATPSWLREVLALLAVAVAATVQSWRKPASSEGQGET